MTSLKRVLFLFPVIAVAAASPVLAAGTTPRYNQVHFQVERSRAVDNDRMQAVLSVTAEDADAARLADQINRTMDWAVKTAKTRPGIEIRSGNYRTYPVYSKDRIQRWRAAQELILEGTDFAGLSTLIGQLQERLQVASINFSVSPTRRAAVEDELIAQALDAFKQRARLVRMRLAAKGYRIVDVAINTGAAPPAPIMMRAAAMETSSIASPAVEAGTSTLSVNVSGVIELQ